MHPHCQRRAYRMALSRCRAETPGATDLGMNKNAYRGHRFPPAIIQVTVWMYARFTLSLRDVEELLAERGLDISYETVRRWFLKFGQVYARSIRHGRHRPTDRWGIVTLLEIDSNPLGNLRS